MIEQDKLVVKNTLPFMNKDNQNYLFNNCDVRVYQSGKVLYHINTFHNYVYLILSGGVKQVTVNLKGNMSTDFVGANKFVGYTGVVNKCEALSTTEVVTESRILILDKEVFTNLLIWDNLFQRHFMKIINEDINRTNRLILCRLQNSLKKRLALSLIELQETFSTNEDNFINAKISRMDIAANIGGSKEATIRTLSEFRDDNLILTSNKKVGIKDKRALMNIYNGRF